MKLDIITCDANYYHKKFKENELILLELKEEIARLEGKNANSPD